MRRATFLGEKATRNLENMTAFPGKNHPYTYVSPGIPEKSQNIYKPPEHANSGISHEKSHLTIRTSREIPHKKRFWV